MSKHLWNLAERITHPGVKYAPCNFSFYMLKQNKNAYNMLDTYFPIQPCYIQHYCPHHTTCLLPFNFYLVDVVTKVYFAIEP